MVASTNESLFFQQPIDFSENRQTDFGLCLWLWNPNLPSLECFAVRSAESTTKCFDVFVTSQLQSFVVLGYFNLFLSVISSLKLGQQNIPRKNSQAKAGLNVISPDKNLGSGDGKSIFF